MCLNAAVVCLACIQGLPCDCPSECSSCRFNAGENNIECLACHDDYYLIGTECLPRGTCLRNTIEGSPTGESCDCGIDSCHRCRIIKATGEVTCTHCRDNTVSRAVKSARSMAACLAAGVLCCFCCQRACAPVCACACVLLPPCHFARWRSACFILAADWVCSFPAFVAVAVMTVFV